MFGKDKSLKISRAWEYFIQLGTLEGFSEKDCVRDVILKSWERSYQHQVDPFHEKKPILSPKEFQQKFQRRKTLINIAKPYMHKLYSFVKNSGFLVILTDEDGYVLESIGDPEITPKAEKSKLILGANRSEKNVGTNAIGTCLVTGQPIQVWAEEHYLKAHHIWTCSAAPIYDPNEKLIGCLDMTGPREKVHAHTLGMVVAAVDGIEKQMRMERAYNHISLINSQLNASLEASSSGTILIDNNGIITQINKLAINMLGIQSDRQIIGKHIDDFIEYGKNIFDIPALNDNIYDYEITLKTKNNSSLHCTLTAVLAKNEQNQKYGIVLTLNTIKRIRKLVNKMTGSQAKFTFDSILGNSHAIQEAKRLGMLAAKGTSNVLLLGESGTGKELFAQSIHNASDRCDGPFIAINCGALPRELIESELFGYEGGAFTGSKKEGHPGKFELANGGTLFLDEIGDMPLDIQVTLLRVLQNREIVRVGGKTVKPIDVRIIAATHKNLEECVENKTFRSDLYYRLNVFSIFIPALRDRKEDIKPLADHFLRKYNTAFHKQVSKINDDVYEALMQYDWPGNVRELENVIERGINICEGKVFTMKELPAHFQIQNKTPAPQKTNMLSSKENIPSQSIENAEYEAIIAALLKTNGNIKQAANILNISRRTLYRKLDKFQIDYSKYRK
ncbi:MAG TPA: sigma-54-dependent Fis family transcriptional regulator [Clostridiales bacterium]|nr:sigma-54-dependent Fis family transcriptional regulator [Clostridiales bacterium]